MQKNVSRLTHFPFWLLLILVAFFVYSMTIPFPQASPLVSALATLQQKPFSSEAHATLAKLYLTLDKRREAHSELKLAQEAGSAAVLGKTTAELEEELTLEPELVRLERAYWEQVVADSPAYRDGWVQLYYIASNLHDNTKAEEYLEKVKQLDPIYLIETD
jgi:thioredoxin-like negative regulator of GroEL